MLHTYICLSNASYNMCMMHLISSEAQSIFNDIGASLDRERKRLIGAISNTMLVGWTLDILRGAGEVHRNTRLLVNCITLMRKAHASTKSSAHSHYTGELHDLIHDTVNYLKDLLLKKSALCSDPSLSEDLNLKMNVISTWMVILMLLGGMWSPVYQNRDLLD